MKPEPDLEYILNLVRTKFDFLFIRGFRIIDIVRQQYHIFWVVLEAQCSIRIGSDRDGIVYITIAKRDTPVEKWEEWFTFGLLIYFLSKHNIYIGCFYGDLNQKDQQYERFAQPMSDYIDEIIALFLSDDFEKTSVELKKLRPAIDQLRYEEYLAHKENRL